jgi:integrase
MRTAGAFTSTLGATIGRYLALKQALGRRYGVERGVLTHLDRFLSATAADLTAETFTQWCRTREHMTSGVRRNWMRIVRNLCLYRQRTEPSSFVPDAAQFPALHQAVCPHIFSEAEVSRLLAASQDLPPGTGSPLRREHFRVAIVLLYTSGLRRGELLRLTVGDYDPKEHTLLVRESKFHKSRLLPLSSDGVQAIDDLLDVRRSRRLATGPEAPLLWNHRGSGRPYTGVGFGTTIRVLLRTTGIRTAAGRFPRVHDFRHTFAVHALLRWYRAGHDVQAKLPLLATYMGHVSIVSTAYYLRFIDQLAGCASERFAQRCGALISHSSLSTGSGGDL